ncbi:MAG: tail fiber domain-containing protein [Chitinophagales bacterium]|nr:tail fiber domain-containing protein [Chitinophagales bacterium]
MKKLFISSLFILVNFFVYAQAPPVTNGLVFRVDAAIGVTFTGTDVTQWNDQTTNSNHLVIPNPAITGVVGTPQIVTVNGRSVIRFNGTNILQSTSTTNTINGTVGTIFVVKGNASTGTEVDVSTPLATSEEMLMLQNEIYHQSSAGNYIGKGLHCNLSNASDDAIRINAGVFRQGALITDMDFYVNGNLSTSTTGTIAGGAGGTPVAYTSVNRRIYVGSRVQNSALWSPGSCDIYEVLIYNRVLTVNEIDQVNSFFECKYGISYAVCSSCPALEPENLFWGLNGNMGITPSNFIGPKNSADFKIRTTDQERMIIKADGLVGIGTSTPTNTIDINGTARIRTLNTKQSNDAIVFSSVDPASNGLLRQLATTLNPTNRYLNESGDWVSVSTNMLANNGCSINGNNVQLGNDVGNNSSPLLNHREISMVNFNLNLLNNVNSTNAKFSVGWLNSTNANSDGAGQISALATTRNDFVGIDPNFNGFIGHDNSIGVFARSTRDKSEWNRNNYGVYGLADFITEDDCEINSIAIGVNGVAKHGRISVGVRGSVVEDGHNCELSPFLHHEVIGGDFSTVSTTATRSIGVRAISAGRSNPRQGATDFSYGILADGGGADANGGLGGQLDYAGFFDGDVFSSSGNYLPSDEKLKTDVHEIKNLKDIISRLNPYSYFYKSEAGISLPKTEQFGFIAQDVEKVLPTLVRTTAIPNSKTNETFMAVNYQGFIPYLWKAAQEQMSAMENLSNKLEPITNLKEKVEELNQKLSRLQQDYDNICNLNCIQQKQSLAVNASSLDQNIPNPFSNSTRIDFNIVGTFSNASIMISDLNGRMLLNQKIVDANQKTMEIDGSKLYDGVFNYTLIIDGREIDTKKMTFIAN